MELILNSPIDPLLKVQKAPENIALVKYLTNPLSEFNGMVRHFGKCTYLQRQKIDAPPVSEMGSYSQQLLTLVLVMLVRSISEFNNQECHEDCVVDQNLIDRSEHCQSPALFYT